MTKKPIWLTILLACTLLSFPAESEALQTQAQTITISTGKKAVRWISYHPSEGVELRPAIAQNKIGMTEELASMAKRHQALAAINGTYFNPYDAKDLQPMGGIVINGALAHIRGGAEWLGIKPNGEIAFTPNSGTPITLHFVQSDQNKLTQTAWFLNHLPTTPEETVVFTPLFRSQTLELPGFSFVIVDQGKVTAVVRDKAVIPAKGFVVAAGPQARFRTGVVKVGDQASYALDWPAELQGSQHMISVGPKLVTEGKLDVRLEAFSEAKITSQKGQRSFIGKKQDQTVVMGTVPGVTMHELAEIAQKLGLVEAMNLDGGASSGLYYQGKYLTKTGRPLSNALVLVKRSPQK
ncbi:phosphodiester glycosidase family protein [Brevibacillus composti]|uniref:Phosphodiester glycosidase family protein n=1 Tax=Brevibacillus composti TaxID=2796470 RepID=A0A7T5EIP7_9BACL|nr:phosphodiester glycosidase family protein [Brevibacillus composti]QQE73357.1 phosphodiester glycosidase family protein [Brevibacillus composti]QUO40438.1 phosphodiester glycosidase family protein [Brevibacillus composti]